MISPLKKYRDQLNWSRLGKGFQITRINRPHFDIFGISLEFDMSPKTWMLKIMRHARVLRLVLPMWHHRERQITKDIREKLLKLISESTNASPEYKRLDQINGYREVRYKKFDEALSE